jgi:hypothetical protein
MSTKEANGARPSVAEDLEDLNTEDIIKALIGEAHYEDPDDQYCIMNGLLGVLKKKMLDLYYQMHAVLRLLLLVILENGDLYLQ